MVNDGGGFPAGCPRVIGDEEENFDADDFEDEFQIKNRHDDLDQQRDVVNAFNDHMKAES